MKIGKNTDRDSRYTICTSNKGLHVNNPMYSQKNI